MQRWLTDTEPSARYPVYTRANAGEVMPDPVSPISCTLGMLNAGEQGWRDAYLRFGSLRADEFEDDRPDCMACFGGYLYLNMSLTRIYGVRCPGLSPELVDLQYFGDLPGIPPYEDEARPGDVDPAATERLGAFLQEYCFGRYDLPELRDDRAEVDRFIAARPDLSDAGAEELVGRLRSILPLYRRLFGQHITVSAASGVGIGAVADVCRQLGRPDLTMSLLAGVGDVDSAAPSWALWDLGRRVGRSAGLTTLFEAGVPGLPGRIEGAAGGDDDVAAFAAEFQRFLARFGARGPNEWEFRSDTWGTRPELPLAAVDRMRLAEDGAAPQLQSERLVAERARVTGSVRTKTDGNEQRRIAFENGLRCALLFTAGRERSKTNCVKVVHEGRLALQELGRRLVDGGHLERAQQICMVTADELDDFVAAPGTFSRILAERERDYLELFDLEPPFVVYHEPPPLTAWARRDARVLDQARPGTVLSGIPGCPGRATGRARVVLDPSDPAALEPGDVLVAPATDPSWTPLFVPAAAVVVDVGAQITHAVIVSRELGIPCVVSVTNGTRLIPDGAMVTVDGTAGTVTVQG